MAIVKNQSKPNIGNINNWIQQAAEKYNQQQEQAKQATQQINNTTWAFWYTPWISTGAYLPEIRQSTKQSNDRWNPNNKMQIEETIGWNNYYYPWGQLTTQWQQNALNNTWHVAWIPQWPDTTIDYSQFQSVWAYTPEQQPAPNTPVTQPTVQKWNNGTVQPTVSTSQTQQPVEEEKTTAEDYWILPAQEKQQPVVDESANEQALANMEADLWQSTEWMLYWKVTADENGWNGIHTSADPYNVEAATNRARIANLKKLQGMSSEDIATSLSSGFSPYGEQAMRDLMQYNPAKYEEVQKYLKEQQWQDAINSITMWKGTWLTSTEAAVSSVNTWVDSWADSISTSPQQAWQLVTNISNTMANNWTATTATQEMLNINSQLADLQYKLDNVQKEAQASFKWDVPQYIVNAKANSLTQQYQAQIEKLQSRYNAAMDLYKTELSNAQWKEEMNLKYLQYQQWISESNWKQYYQSMQLKQDSVKRVNGKAYQLNYDGTMTQISDTTAYTTYMNNTSQLLQWYIAQYTNGGATKTANWYKYNISWWQCETFTDNFTEAVTWLRMTWANGRSRTTAEEKLWYINSFTPEVWSVAIAVWWAYDSTYWHTMLVTWYDEATWMVSLLWSNNGGDEMVYSSTVSLKDLANSWVKGFRNPYYDMAAQNADNWGYSYEYFNTPMWWVFDRLSADTSLTAGQKSKLPVAMEMYNTLYWIVNDGSWDELANNEDIALIYQDMKNQSFWTANDDWAAFKKALNKSIRNRLAEATSWTPAYDALLNLQRLIELKLRDESWAAISSSEWMSNFSMLLPQAWESATTKQNKLKTWNNIIATKFMSSGWTSKEYVPIWEYSSTRVIR